MGGRFYAVECTAFRGIDRNGTTGVDSERGEVFSRLRLLTRLRRAGPSTDDSGSRIKSVGHESGAANKQESSASTRRSGAGMKVQANDAGKVCLDEVCCRK